jgi:serine/threonine protein kinase
VSHPDRKCGMGCRGSHPGYVSRVMVRTLAVRLPDRYRDPRLVAQGGMGQIYCASDSTLSRVVAIKLLDERFAADSMARKRFTREALAAARLSSDPNTITIFDVGECEGRPFIVMEYMPGGSLQDVLEREGAQPPSRVLEWLDQTAQALDRAHERNVVHRDVKPANLLLSEDGRIRVADFGVASAAGLDSFTQTGTVIGTAGYLSPEQADGRPATPASDRYSLGVVGFELLAGSRPFKRDSAAAEAAAHVQDAPPSISSANPELPPQIDGVVMRALAKDPAERFSTCGEFVAWLRSAFAEAAGPTRIITTPAPQSAPPTVVQPGRVYADASRGRRRLLLPLILVALVAGALAAILVTRPGSDSSSDRIARITVTARGTTIARTVTEQASSPPQASQSAATIPSAASTTPSSSGTSLALRAYRRMQAGDYTEALPLLEQAAKDLQGSGSLDEAYNEYNLAFTLARTEGCSTRILQLLDASQAIQGHRKPISNLRHACKKSR